MVLILPTGLLFLCLWHNTWEVTNCTARRMEEPLFFHYSFNPLNAELNPICHLLALLGAHHLLNISRIRVKILDKTRKVYQDAVGLCQNIMTPQWNNYASFYVVVTVIQIVIMTEGAALLEQTSLSFHCHICGFISQSVVKFSCGTILVEVWNSKYVVLILKCVFILKMAFSPLFFEMQYVTVFTVVERLCDIKYCHNILVYCCSVIQFSPCDFSINISVFNNIWYRIWGADIDEDS